jgi:hypothetical protein
MQRLEKRGRPAVRPAGTEQFLAVSRAVSRPPGKRRSPLRSVAFRLHRRSLSKNGDCRTQEVAGS